MRILSLLPFFCLLLLSCDPGYSVIISNKSRKTIYVETNKAIENYLVFKKNSFYDSIISKKVNSSDINGLYKLIPNEQVNLFGYIGKPSQDFFPFKSVKLIMGLDTLSVNNRNLMQLINKRVKNYYYIEIK